MIKKAFSKCLIIGIENCDRCRILHERWPLIEFIKLPDTSLGLGDTIEKLAWKLGIEKCSACKKRHYWLNLFFPYFWRSDKETRKLRTQLVKIDATIFPVIVLKNMSGKLDLKVIDPEFYDKYMTED
jgi:hypothetical protein